MVIISPPVFDLLFYIAGFLLGLDFFISGILVLQENSVHRGRSRLVGIWIIRNVSALYGSTSRSNFLSFVYSTRNLAIQTLFGGVLVVVGSLIMIVDIGVRLF